MKGKILFVAGVATGYVLGTRAGRKRYEQIRSAWQSVWNAAPVQKQVQKAEDFAKAKLSELPSALAHGLGSTVAALGNRNTTPGEKLDATIESARKSVDEAAKAVDEAAEKAQSSKRSAPKKAASTSSARSKTSGSSASKKKSTGSGSKRSSSNGSSGRS